MGFFDSIWLFILSIFSLTVPAMVECSFDSDTGIITSDNCFIQEDVFIFNLFVTNGASLLIKPNPNSEDTPKTNVSTNEILVNSSGNITIEPESMLKGVRYANDEAYTEVRGTLRIDGSELEGGVVDEQPPDISCDNCHEISGATIAFNPIIEDPDPSSGIKVMRICKDAVCNEAICFSLQDSCSANLLELDSESCTFVEIPYWVYVEDNSGNFNILKGGQFSTKKETGCICSFDEECYSGLCTGSPSTCSENTVPDIDLK